MLKNICRLYHRAAIFPPQQLQTFCHRTHAKIGLFKTALKSPYRSIVEKSDGEGRSPGVGKAVKSELHLPQRHLYVLARPSAERKRKHKPSMPRNIQVYTSENLHRIYSYPDIRTQNTEGYQAFTLVLHIGCLVTTG